MATHLFSIVLTESFLSRWAKNSKIPRKIHAIGRGLTTTEDFIRYLFILLSIILDLPILDKVNAIFLSKIFEVYYNRQFVNNAINWINELVNLRISFKNKINIYVY